MMADTDARRWRAAVIDAALPSLTKLICLILCEDVRYGTAVVRIASLATRARVSRRTVKAHLRRAAGAGFCDVRPAVAPASAWVVTPRLPAPIDAPAPPAQVRWLRLLPGDPRRAAWLEWMRHQPNTSNRASEAVRMRLEIEAPENWPPDDPSVDVSSDLGLVTIPWGTPEHAAWLAHWRRIGRVVAAQAADVSKRQITERHRWPPLVATEAALG